MKAPWKVPILYVCVCPTGFYIKIELLCMALGRSLYICSTCISSLWHVREMMYYCKCITLLFEGKHFGKTQFILSARILVLNCVLHGSPSESPNVVCVISAMWLFLYCLADVIPDQCRSVIPCDQMGHPVVNMIKSKVSFCWTKPWKLQPGWTVQGGWGGWPTGNGNKLSNSQACCLAQLCLAAA